MSQVGHEIYGAGRDARDHIAVPPAGGRVFVFGDDARYDVITGLMIMRITVDRETASQTQ